MAKLSSLEWKRTSRARPAEAERSWLAFDPAERCVWLVVHDSSRRGVWRERGGTFELIAGPDELALPAGYYPTEFLPYFDGSKKAMMLAVGNSVGGDSDKLHIARWDGKKLAPEKTKDAVLWADDDALVFDTRRNVLVHLLVKEDWQRGEASGFFVRELHDGAWKQVGELPETPKDFMGHLMAGFDEARGVVVWIAPNGKCFGWDGKRWDALPKIPTKLAPITEEDYQKHQLTLEPRTRGLLAIAPEGKDDDEHAVAWVLGKDKWQKTKLGWSSWGAAAYDAARKQVVVAFVEPKDGPKSVLAGWDGARLAPIGPPVTGSARAAHGGELVCTEGRDVFLVSKEDAAQHLGSTKEWIGAWVVTGDGFVGVGATGEAWSVSGGKLAPIATPPKEWMKRSGMAAAWDGASSRVLVTCGKGDKRRVQETWSLARAGSKWSWEKLAPKGAHPAEYRPVAAAVNSVLVLTSGVVDYNWVATNKTWELESNRWNGYPTKPALKKEHGERALFVDPVTGHVVFTRWDGEVRVSIYQGGGVFREVASVRAVQPKPRYSAGGANTQMGTTGPLFWDASSRSLVSYDVIDDGCSSFGRMEVDLGPLLDALPKPKRAGATPAPATAAQKGIPFAPKRWLRFQEGSSDKFWFAELDGKSWTARWGRRGTEGQSKKYTLASAEAARKAFEQAVTDKLRKGYEDATADAATVKGRKAFPFKLAKSGDDVFGGTPPGIDAAGWPVCAECNHPMAFVAMFRAHPERMPLTRHAGVAVFCCMGDHSGGTCESWEPAGGCNAALLVDEATVKGKPLRAPPAGPKGPPATLASKRFSYEAKFEADPETENPEKSGYSIHSKVGGYPDWVQSDETVHCEKCKKPMVFRAQLSDGLDRKMNFGDGVGYLFTCSDEHGASFLWQR